nr:GIY-YIG nuclease family protein [Desulfovibrio sp.]
RFFQQALSILKTKDVLLQKPLEAHARPGALFILRGQLCYVDSVLEGRSGKEGHGGENRRLHCVFDNGTELDLLTFSLMRALYADKHAKFVNMAPNLFSEHVVSVTAKDQPTGFVYVLETLSTAPELAELKARRHLVKIGYSTQPVDKRIAGAEKDQTYLCAPVRKAAEIACYNLNPQKFEHLIHGFLNKQKLAVKLVNARTGKVYEPKEWFTVSFQTAIDVCRHIVDGDISLYRMNNVTGEIVKK